MRETLDELVAILEREDEVDDALRAAVTALAAAPGGVWAGIAFLEEGELVLGPTFGKPDPSRRASTPISYGGDVVGELRVDGEVDQEILEQAARLVSPYVLLGWDTGGEAWEP
jgi:putative methionine-R-sulfoxide reductase with GAF domain